MIQNIQLSAILLTTMLACTSQSGVDLPTDLSMTSKVVADGHWQVTYFFDSDKEETSKFSGYTFSFNSDNTILATKASSDVRGKWIISDSHSSDDNPDHVHFILTFPGNTIFDDLNEDWNFVRQTSKKIELIHVSGGNGGTDYLTFEKI
jgi:hypothetical protein